MCAASNSVECAAILAKAGGIEKIKREKSGVRTVLDLDEVLKYKWPNLRGNEREREDGQTTPPADYKFNRSNYRAVDDKAKNLGRESVYYMF